MRHNKNIVTVHSGSRDPTCPSSTALSCCASSARSGWASLRNSSPIASMRGSAPSTVSHISKTAWNTAPFPRPRTSKQHSKNFKEIRPVTRTTPWAWSTRVVSQFEKTVQNDGINPPEMLKKICWNKQIVPTISEIEFWVKTCWRERPMRWSRRVWTKETQEDYNAVESTEWPRGTSEKRWLTIWLSFTEFAEAKLPWLLALFTLRTRTN